VIKDIARNRRYRFGYLGEQYGYASRCLWRALKESRK
jgi:hypothetical protein